MTERISDETLREWRKEWTPAHRQPDRVEHDVLLLIDEAIVRGERIKELEDLWRSLPVGMPGSAPT